MSAIRLAGRLFSAIFIAVAVVALATDVVRATPAPPGYAIYATAVDMDPVSPAQSAHNSVGAAGGIDPGDIQPFSANVPIAGEVCVDVVVDEVPLGILAVIMEVNWNGGIAGLIGYRAGSKNVGAVSACPGLGTRDDFLYSEGNEFALSQTNSSPNPSGASPNTTGSFEIENAWENQELGPGRLAQFAFRCLATGQTTISLAGPDLGPGYGPSDKPHIYYYPAIDGNGLHTIANDFEGTLFCNTEPGSTPTPTPNPTINPNAPVGGTVDLPASPASQTPSTAWLALAALVVSAASAIALRVGRRMRQ